MHASMIFWRNRKPPDTFTVTAAPKEQPQKEIIATNMKDKNNSYNKEETVVIMSLGAPQSFVLEYWGLVVWFK